VFAGVVEIEVHLPGIGIAELAHLEVNDDQASQAAVKQEEIDAKPGVVDTEPLLPTEKSEVVAQLQQKIGEIVDECLFKIAFRLFVLEAEKLKHERVFNGFLRRDGIAGFGYFRFLKHGGFVPGKRDALVKLAANLTIKLANRPAGTQGLCLIRTPEPLDS
jgi:hypothetical protein